MNVWEFLGLPANHRPKNKTVQLVKHYDEVPESKRSFPLIAQPKKDGVYAMVVFDHSGVCGVFGRTGEKLTSCEHVISQFSELFMESHVFIGELLSGFDCSLEELSGVVNPNRVNQLDSKQMAISMNLFVALHDSLPLRHFIEGKSPGSYCNRFGNLCNHLRDTELFENIISYTTIYDQESLDLFAVTCIESGEEGAVFKQPEGGWVAGHKGYRSMKVVGEVSYDLKCIGYEEGEGKYAGKVANLIFQWRDGQTIKAMLGKGWTHSDAEQMYNVLQHPEGHYGTHALYAIGKVFKVKGLMDSSKGKIRLPKVAECRIDKFEGDY